jgi:hypothetical protein
LLINLTKIDIPRGFHGGCRLHTFGCILLDFDLLT